MFSLVSYASLHPTSDTGNSIARIRGVGGVTWAHYLLQPLLLLLRCFLRRQKEIVWNESFVRWFVPAAVLIRFIRVYS